MPRLNLSCCFCAHCLPPALGGPQLKQQSCRLEGTSGNQTPSMGGPWAVRRGPWASM